MVESIKLVLGKGVEGDAHFGTSIQHRSRVRKDPSQPNLRQIHLIHAELFKELLGKGFSIKPGELGENILTAGIDLLSLPKNTELHFDGEAAIRLTGLRNPCQQLNEFQAGLMQALLDRTSEGKLIRKAGVMGMVIRGGTVQAGSVVSIKLPPESHQILERV